MLLQYVIVSDGAQGSGPLQLEPAVCPSGWGCHRAMVNFLFSENFLVLLFLYERRRGLPAISSHYSKDDLKWTIRIRLKVILFQRTWWICKVISRIAGCCWVKQAHSDTGYFSSSGVSAKAEIEFYVRSIAWNCLHGNLPAVHMETAVFNTFFVLCYIWEIYNFRTRCFPGMSSQFWRVVWEQTILSSSVTVFTIVIADC